MARHLPDLIYSKDDLHPLLGARTLEVHHGKHHRSYVDKVNELEQGTPFAQLGLFELVAGSRDDLYQSAAQHLNHSFYWRCIAPVSMQEPEGELAQALVRDFGSLEGFRERFAEGAKGLFGSGWCWLSRSPEGTLRIDAQADADGPWKHNATPVLTCDVWEHAYYLDYENERGRYVDAFLEQVDWAFAGRCFAHPAGIEDEILGTAAAR